MKEYSSTFDPSLLPPVTHLPWGEKAHSLSEKKYFIELDQQETSEKQIQELFKLQKKLMRKARVSYERLEMDSHGKQIIGQQLFAVEDEDSFTIELQTIDSNNEEVHTVSLTESEEGTTYEIIDQTYLPGISHTTSVEYLFTEGVLQKTISNAHTSQENDNDSFTSQEIALVEADFVFIAVMLEEFSERLYHPGP